MDKLVKQVKGLLEQGVWDPEELFELINRTNRKHYSTLRRAIHIAKTRS